MFAPKILPDNFLLRYLVIGQVRFTDFFPREGKNGFSNKEILKGDVYEPLKWRIFFKLPDDRAASGNSNAL